MNKIKLFSICVLKSVILKNLVSKLKFRKNEIIVL
jgi:hypothetical protein